MSVNTYLTFDGNCREAFEFYRSVFGGDFNAFSTFADGPEDMEVADACRHNVMHVSLPIGSSVLMGSDNAAHGPALAIGNNFSLAVNGEGREHSDELLARLAAGGIVTMAMQDTFWGAYFGMCTDRFGINWMVVCEQARE